MVFFDKLFFFLNLARGQSECEGVALAIVIVGGNNGGVVYALSTLGGNYFL